MRKRYSKFCEDGERRVPIQIWVEENTKKILYEYCKYLNVSVSAYFNELIARDEGFKKWARENGKTLNL